MTPRAGSNRFVEWAIASRPLPGELRCGDAHVVRALPGGVLAAVMDGLGHGRLAAQAALRAARILARHRQERPVPLMRRCHDALADTRGVTMTLARFEATSATMSWLGVGNVQGVLLRRGEWRRMASEALLLRAGVVGHHIPVLRESTVSVMPGDLLMLATDGVRPDFVQSVIPAQPVQALADRILAQHVKDTDDGLVLVARYLGT